VLDGRIRSIGFGVSVAQPTPPGSLPTVQNSRDWLRAAQRFPVIVGIDPGQLEDSGAIRVGGQAEVMAFPIEGNPLNLLGRVFLRLMSWLSYAY
jgi:multidrug resistance efflux pump